MKPFLTCIFVLVLASCSTSITKEELEATKNQKPEDLVPAGLLSKKNLDEEFPTEAPSPNLVEDVFHLETSQKSATKTLSGLTLTTQMKI